MGHRHFASLTVSITVSGGLAVAVAIVIAVAAPIAITIPVLFAIHPHTAPANQLLANLKLDRAQIEAQPRRRERRRAHAKYRKIAGPITVLRRERLQPADHRLQLARPLAHPER